MEQQMENFKATVCFMFLKNTFLLAATEVNSIPTTSVLLKKYLFHLDCTAISWNIFILKFIINSIIYLFIYF